MLGYTHYWWVWLPIPLRLSFRGTKIWSAGSRVASFFSLYFFAAAFQVVALAVWVGLIDDPTTVLKVAANSVVIAATTIFRFVFVLKIFRRRVEGP
jgi:putative flippase GtrA